MTSQSNDQILHRAALRFELQSVRGAVLNAYVLNRTESAAKLEEECMAPLAPLHAAMSTRLCGAPPLDAATVGMARGLLVEMADRFAQLTGVGRMLRQRVQRLIDLLDPVGQPPAAPMVPIAPTVQPVVVPVVHSVKPEPVVQGASQDDVEIEAIVEGPRMPPRALELERRAAAAQRQFDASDLSQLLMPLASDQRATEKLLVCGQTLRGELVVRRAVCKDDSVTATLSASSVSDHWFAALRGGGAGELLGHVRARRLAYAVSVDVPDIPEIGGCVVVAAHAGLWQHRSPELSCAASAPRIRAALLRRFGDERVLEYMFASVDKWQECELRNWKVCAEQTARQQHLLAHERDEALKDCSKMKPVHV